MLALAVFAGCSFNGRVAPGKITCQTEADCPGEAPVCLNSACYPSGWDGGAGGDTTGAGGVGTGGAAAGAGGTTGSGGAVDGAVDTSGRPDAADGSVVDVPSVDVPPVDVRPVDWPVCAPTLPPGSDLSKGLVFYLHLDEIGSNPLVNDSSPNHLQVMANNLGIGTLRTSSGRFGSALILSGGIAGDWLTVAAPSTALNTIIDGLTLSVWVKFPPGKPADGVLLSRRAAGPHGYLYRFSISNGRLRAQLHTANGNHADVVGNRDLPADGRWMHLGFTYADTNRQGVSIYANGESYGNDPLFALQLGAENTSVLVGAAEDPAVLTPETTIIDQAQGIIDEVAVYNRALAQSEIIAITCGAMPYTTAMAISKAKNGATP